MSADPATAAPTGSKLALGVLVAIVILSPWPFGSAHLRTTQAIALVSLATALGAFLWDGGHRQVMLPPRTILWPLLGLWVLAVCQLVPLPEALHRSIAPASAAVWHPGLPAAAAVLGPGPHPTSIHPDATRRWLAFGTGVLALTLAAAPALRERRLLLRASTVVVAGGVLVAAYGFVARLAFGNTLYGVWAVPTVAPFGPFVSKNHFAGYVELAAILAVGLATGLADEARHGTGWLSWIESRRSKWVVAAWGAAFVLVLAVPVSLSRGGVISLAAGLACFVLLRIRLSREAGISGLRIVTAAAALAASGLLLVVVLPTEARGRVLTLAGITSDPSGSYRLALWGDTLRLAGGSPAVGSGFGAYEDAIPQFKTTAGGFAVQHAENDHLELLAEGGLLAVLLSAGAAVALLLLGLRAFRVTEQRLTRALLAAALAGGAATYVHSAVDFTLRIPSNALTAAFLAGTAVAATLQGPRARETGTGRLRWAAGPVLVALSSYVAVSTPWREQRWDPAALNRAHGASTDLRRSALESEVTAFLRQRPAHAPAWVHLGWLRLPASREDASALARWGVALDPSHDVLARVSAPLRDAGR